LSSVFVSNSFQAELEQAIIAEIENEKLVDLVNLVPSYFTEPDIESVLKNIELGQNIRLGNDWLITTNGLNASLELFESIISSRYVYILW